MNDMTTPIVYVNFIEVEIKKNEMIYKEAYSLALEAMTLLNIISQSQKQESSTSTIESKDGFEADEILIFK